MHYGAHQPWKFFSVTHVDKIGDTLVFERNVFPNEPPFDNQRLLEINYVKMLVHDENHVTVLKDSLNYNWPDGPKFTKKRGQDHLSLYYHDARKVNFDAVEGASYTVTPNKAGRLLISSVRKRETPIRGLRTWLWVWVSVVSTTSSSCLWSGRKEKFIF